MDGAQHPPPGRGEVPAGSVFQLLFYAALAANLVVANLGGSHTDLGFRPSQTALTAWYALHEGFRLDYVTPVLGPPWSIPFEFPLYQWLAALLSLATGLSLTTAGRLVSLAFFYACLPFTASLLRRSVPRHGDRLLFLSLILANPIYLFWSTTFLIESTALFFSVSFLWSTVRWLEEGRARWALLALLLGSGAALVKITTFALFLVPWACLLLAGLRRPAWARLAVGLLAGALPLVPGVAWTRFADSLKSLNPLAETMTSGSPEMIAWNFGPLAMRFEPAVWTTIMDRTAVLTDLGSLPAGAVQVPLLPLLAVAVLALTRTRVAEAALCFLFFLVGPLVFTNLYFVHDYYYCANSLFLCLAVGFVVLSVHERLERSSRPLWRGSAGPVAGGILTVLLLSFASTYWLRYMDRQLTGVTPQFQAAMGLIRERTREDDILLVYGQGWSADVPYRTGRRAIVDWLDLPLESERMQRLLRNLEGRRIGAMIVMDERGADFIEPRLRYFGLHPDPRIQGLYFAEPAPEESAPGTGTQGP